MLANGWQRRTFSDSARWLMLGCPGLILHMVSRCRAQTCRLLAFLCYYFCFKFIYAFNLNYAATWNRVAKVETLVHCFCIACAYTSMRHHKKQRSEKKIQFSPAWSRNDLFVLVLSLRASRAHHSKNVECRCTAVASFVCFLFNFFLLCCCCCCCARCRMVNDVYFGPVTPHTIRTSV